MAPKVVPGMTFLEISETFIFDDSTIIFLVFWCAGGSLRGPKNKKKLEIINSNFSYYDASINADVRYLVDSVIFKHEGAMQVSAEGCKYLIPQLLHVQ